MYPFILKKKKFSSIFFWLISPSPPHPPHTFFFLICHLWKAMVFSSHQLCFSFQETGESVGTVVKVYNSGASDLLHVKLDSSVNLLPKTGELKTTETRVSDHLIWVPFVEEIVPYVDMNRREMQITPPKGLLELNLRLDERSKKERRQLVRHTLLYSTIDSLKLLVDINFI